MKKRNIIGSNLRYLRKKHGFSQEQFVARLHIIGLNIDRTSLSRIENYTRVVYDYELVFFSEALDVSILELYNPNIYNLQDK